jgi:hypothetical protein
MLIELPVMVVLEGGVIVETPVTFKLRNIESVSRIPSEEEICELHTLGGDECRINLPYEHMVKFWNDSLDTLNNSVFISRVKKQEVNNSSLN